MIQKLQLITPIIQYDSIDELSAIDQLLIKSAQSATQKSYSPYSKFKVGAALRLDNDLIVDASNQENAAYPSGLCAERVALFYANSQYPNQAVDVIAISVFANGIFLEDPIPPCGGCRQVLIESEQRSGKSMRIILAGTKKIYEIACAADLLPIHFDSKFLPET